MRTITIKIVSDAGEQTPNPNGNVSQNAPNPSAKKTKGSDDAMKTFGIYVARRAYYLAKSTASQYVNKYFNASEMYREQMMISNTMNTIDYFVDIGTSGMFVSKMLAGTAAGGPVGFAIGAGIMALTKGIQRFNELSNQAQQLVDSSYGNYFNSTRAGFVAGGHNTEN